MPSRIIDLKTAAYEILSAYESLEHGQPFFIMAGAGISVPGVPLASQIISHCRAKTAHYGPGFPAEPTTVLDQYSYWFDRAYPQPIDRQRYLRDLIQNKPITNACLRLAHLLGSRRTVSLVVTTNFDDLISRALSVFAVPYTICDHPETVDRIDLGNQETKIVHVHGSYKFYDCRNLREEVENRARPSVGTVRTMAAFLDRALSFSSPLVVGYSGWEGDVVMSALRRRLEGASLPYRLYWFCYERDSVHDLEHRVPWLTDHPDVRFVAPAEHFPGDPSATDASTTSLAALPPILPAKQVFEELIRTFSIEEPELTRDPVRFFAHQLRVTLSSEAGSVDLQGLYSFATVVNRLVRAADLEAEEFRIAAMSSEGGIDSVRRLLRQSQYRQALGAISLFVERAEFDELEQIFELLQTSFDKAELSAADSLVQADLLLKLSKTLPSRNGDAALTKHIEWITQRGVALYHLDRAKEALDTYDSLPPMLDEGVSAEVATLLRYALTRKALAFSQLERHAEAVQLYDVLVPKLTARSEAWLAAQSIFNRSYALDRLGKVDEAIMARLGFVETYRTARDGWTQVLVLSAASSAAGSLDRAGKTDRSIALLNDVLALYSEVDNAQVRELLARGVLQLAEMQEKVGNLSEAGANLDKLANLAPGQLSGEIQKVRTMIKGKLDAAIAIDGGSGKRGA